jgi:hypothetical protein
MQNNLVWSQEPGQIQECWVCLENVEPSFVENSIPQCMQCVNGHHIHVRCYNGLYRKKCGICSSTNFINCYSKAYGYRIRQEPAAAIAKGTKIKSYRKLKSFRKINSKPKRKQTRKRRGNK